MLDRKKLRTKVLLDLATKPIVLVPFLIGASSLIVLWAFSIASAIWSTISALSFLGSLGLFLTTFILGDETISKKALQRLKEEEERTQNEELDRLDKQLGKDKDTKTQQMLRDIRQMVPKFKDENLIDNIESSLMVDIVAGVEELFDSSVKSIRKAIELQKTAKEIESKVARAKILDRRDRIVGDINKNVEQMGSMLADIQAMDMNDETNMSKLRDQLAENVDTAKRVKARLQNIGPTGSWDITESQLREMKETRNTKEIERA